MKRARPIGSFVINQRSEQPSSRFGKSAGDCRNIVGSEGISGGGGRARDAQVQFAKDGGVEQALDAQELPARILQETTDEAKRKRNEYFILYLESKLGAGALAELEIDSGADVAHKHLNEIEKELLPEDLSSQSIGRSCGNARFRSGRWT